MGNELTKSNVCQTLSGNFPAPIILKGRLNRHVINNTIESLVIESSLGFYDIGPHIAECSTGNVRVGFHLEHSVTGKSLTRVKRFAIKTFLREKFGILMHHVLQEIAFMQYLDNKEEGNENIARQVCAISDSDGNIYNIMEYYEGGDLHHIIENSGSISEGIARLYFLNIVKGVQYIHQKDICHRDLSLDNILVSKDGMIVISDLGMCLRIQRHPETGLVCLTPPQGHCGKDYYMAPEILENKKSFNGLLVDMWALGVVLFIMVCGVPPFEIASMRDSRYRLIQTGCLRDMLRHWGIKLSSDLIDLLQKMLNNIPDERLSFDEILAHSWMRLCTG